MLIESDENIFSVYEIYVQTYLYHLYYIFQHSFSHYNCIFQHLFSHYRILERVSVKSVVWPSIRVMTSDGIRMKMELYDSYGN